MKTYSQLTLALASCAVLPLCAAHAQTPAPTATPSVSAPTATTTTTSSDSTATTTAPAGGEHNARREAAKERMDALTPEEKAELKGAHEKALQDPAVKAAEPTKETDKKGYREAVHAAMLRADPNVGAILAKLRPGKHEQL